MKWKTASLKTRLYIIAAAVLLAGLGSAVSIYLTAENDDGNFSDYGSAASENSKMYVHDLELYGGKANMLAEEFRNWFAALWHGKSLAFTVSCITIFISFGCFFVARHLPSDSSGEIKKRVT